MGLLKNHLINEGWFEPAAIHARQALEDLEHTKSYERWQSECRRRDFEAQSAWQELEEARQDLINGIEQKPFEFIFFE